MKKHIEQKSFANQGRTKKPAKKPMKNGKEGKKEDDNYKEKHIKKTESKENR